MQTIQLQILLQNSGGIHQSHIKPGRKMGSCRRLLFNLDLSEPVEITDFVKAFAGLGGQFERFIKAEHPELDGEVKVYVKEVRKGSIEAELIPLAYNTLITSLDHLQIATKFVKSVARRLGSFDRPGGRLPDASKTELTEIVDTLSGVANDPDGRATIKSVKYRKTKTTTDFQIEMTTPEARAAISEIEGQFLEIEQKSSFDYSKVLLTFHQTNKKDADKTGEKGIIEEISMKPIAVVYASDLAREKIKSEMLSGDRNVYKLGFFVDVNVSSRNGKPVAYNIKSVSDVIELPDDD